MSDASPIQAALASGWQKGTEGVPARNQRVDLAVVDRAHERWDLVPSRRPDDRFVYVEVRPLSGSDLPWAGFSLLRMPPEHEHEADEVHHEAYRLGKAYAEAVAQPA